ncbi:phosphorelay protein [Colwellia sp. M166]|uniref:Hpt domain-containing protein n=1 Tax=Colwellia sp. M166 TaxID=2583805 RepID=UPI00211E8C8B|nr:Hpt domain-containing protein [Colwellia sp. M166]UUO24022.1 phosphorelay protein [Colwellia sp. M166]|tara:strand:- start:68793 stop:69140 length:348 start_codon:yes stop_codon:yes gene_type:complete
MIATEQLDLSLINGYLEALDIAIIQQMLDLYIQQSALYLAAINTAIVAEDQKAWQEHCHKMKGSAASAGLSQVHQKLVAIEKMTENWQVKVTHLHVLTQLNQQAIEVFRQWLAKQ